MVRVRVSTGVDRYWEEPSVKQEISEVTLLVSGGRGASDSRVPSQLRRCESADSFVGVNWSLDNRCFPVQFS